MLQTVITLSCLLYGIFYFKFFKGTFFEVSWKKRTFAGLILAKEIFVLIIPGVLLHCYGIYKDYTHFYLTDNSVKQATVFAIYSVFSFSITVGIICKLASSRSFLRAHNYKPIERKDEKHLDRTFFGIVILLSLLSILFIALGMKHAFITSIFSGADLMTTRMQNRYSTSIPTVLMSLYRFLYILASILFGMSISRNKWVYRFLGLTIILFATTFFGDKAPALAAFTLIILGYVSTNRKISLAKAIKYSLIIGSASILIIYILSSIQFREGDSFDFHKFILMRAGLGQVGGFYEQFALKLQDPAYVWHSIPFANFFMDYPIYNKDLMTNLWGANVAANETGVVNSFFPAEALAIGGIPLAIASPFIFGINYCVAIVALGFAFRKLLGYSFNGTHLVLQLLVPSLFVLTGDIAGLMFHKLLVMLLIFLAILSLTKKIYQNIHLIR